MALSEDERLLLSQIEEDLARSDPRLRARFDGARLRFGAGRRWLVALLVPVGLLLVALGVRLAGTLGVWAAALGYLLTVGATTNLIAGAPRTGRVRRVLFGAPRGR